MRKWSPLFVVLALPIAFFATATVIGIGILRQGSPAWIAGVGILAVVLPPMALIVSRILKWFLFSVGLIGWSMTIMYVFPVFFPGERGREPAEGQRKGQEELHHLLRTARLAHEFENSREREIRAVGHEGCVST